MERTQRFTFAKSHRLLSSSDYSRVFEHAEIKISHQHVLILARTNLTGHPRLGLVAAKKNLKLAASRNRFKRCVRETFRANQHTLPAIDAIVLARRGADEQSTKELQLILAKLWVRVAKKALKNA